MSLQPPEPDLKNIWQNQEMEKATMSIEEVRLKAQKIFYRRRRDLIARSVFVLLSAVFCGIFLATARMTPVRELAGFVMAILLASTIRNLYLSYVRSDGGLSTVGGSPNTALTSCLEFYRGELERQREFARLPSWQLVTVLVIIVFLIRDALMRIGTDTHRFVLPFVLIAAAGLIVLTAVRKFEARRVQDDINALDTFEDEMNSGDSHDVAPGEDKR